MAVPRVFISSTYYDLKQVRNIVGTFISGLGYEPVMHERADVAYSQSVPLENDCYNEVTGCDIIVCIIGNHFGSQSSDNDLSITMNEVMTAIKEKKKVYIFISNDVYVENRTYIQNKDTGTFKSAYTDNIKIHEFMDILAFIKNKVGDPNDEIRKYVRRINVKNSVKVQTLILRKELFDTNGTIQDIRNKDKLSSYILFNETIEMDEELPF